MTDDELLDALVEALTPLMESGGVCSPFISAWEIDTNHGADGEEMHARIKELWLLGRSKARLRKLKGPHIIPPETGSEVQQSDGSTEGAER